jgi:hypothetical protein
MAKRKSQASNGGEKHIMHEKQTTKNIDEEK